MHSRSFTINTNYHFLHNALCFYFHRSFAKYISLYATAFSVLPQSKVSVNNKDITLAIRERGDEGLHYPASFFPSPPTLLFAFYLRQLIICYWSARTVSWFRAVTSKPAAAIMQRNEQISKLFWWYPYLRVDCIRCIRSWPGSGSFAPQWQVHHHPPVTLAPRDDAGFVLRQAHLGMFGSVLIDMIILNVSA